MDLLIPLLRGAIIFVGLVGAGACLLTAIAIWRGRLVIERRPVPTVDAENRWASKDAVTVCLRD